MELQKRKRNRLENYDYSQTGTYFITLCVNKRKQLFQVENVGNDLCVVPNTSNYVVHKWVKELENKFNIIVDKYVIMPDHIHLLLTITERHTGRSLQDVMRWFKIMTTNDYIKGVKEGRFEPFPKKLWQKSYYDHIIRNQNDFNEAYEYIENNPIKYIISNNP